MLQVSYARTLETPFNENLVLASLGCNDPVINDLQSTLQGYPCLTSPLSPGWRNEFHAGLQQAFGRYLVISGEYIWKYTHKAYDFSVLGNTPITYPIEWASSKIPGFAIRASMPNFHGFTAFVVMSSVAARFFTPQVSGIGTTPTSFGSGQRIPHRPRRDFQCRPLTCNIRSGRGDRGSVSTGAMTAAWWPVRLPCAGGNCANGPNGTDSIVDVSNLTPDQQFEAGLFCGSVHATPTTPISATGLCPASQYGSTLLQIPAAGTENDDHNPPRIASRNLFDIAMGHDNLFHGDRYKWSARLSIVNLDEQGSAV